MANKNLIRLSMARFQIMEEIERYETRVETVMCAGKS